MEQTKENSSRSLSKFFPSQPLKKMITQLLLSVSFFSFLCSYYSLCSPSLFHPRKLLPSFHLPIHSINKNCIFLLCNGLLVFLSKTSGLLARSSSACDMLQMMLGDVLHTHNGAVELPYSRKESFEPLGEEDDEEETRNEEKDIAGETNTMEVSIFIAESDEDRGSCDRDEEGSTDRRDSEDRFEEEALSTEELNQKCEAFIRKMKEEIMVTDGSTNG